ncbi:MAG: ABC transporter permease [Tannerellaceae bacterium]
MIKQYMKQALQMLRENPLISSISIAGTALSIAMIMVVVLVFQVQSANFRPEVNRDRMMYIEFGTEVESGDNRNRGAMSSEAVRECFYTLKTPEAVSAWADMEQSLSIPGKRMYKAYSVKYTDPGFWTIYAFRFLSGKPFTEADFRSAIPQAVVSENVARKLYGTTEVVGKEIIIGMLSYTICGVVSNVSRAADTSYAEVWAPYSSSQSLLDASFMENMSGVFKMCLLAKTTDDFAAIRQELKKETARYNSTKQDARINFLHNPISRMEKAIGSEGQVKVEWKDYLVETGGLLLFLLLVPALNLLGVIQSSVQKRREELGVRKAFGATPGVLIRQILIENGVTTLLGGAIGLILSFALLPLCRDFLFKNADTALNGDMLFQPAVFGLALLFSLILNLLSACVPAVHIARQQISDALSGNENNN